MISWLKPLPKSRDQVIAGTFLNLASATTVEIAAECGFDWLLIDLEHGTGSLADLRAMLHACRRSDAVPIVRLRSVEPDDVKFVMDSGAAGIMFPYVGSVRDAEAAVRAVKYPPQGQRGIASGIRANGYSREWEKYLSEANERSAVIVQIETPEAAREAELIAAVEGVDALFVGPLDLSVNLGDPGNFESEKFTEHLSMVVTACRRHDRLAGILTRPNLVGAHIAMGFRLVALGSDMNCVVQGMQAGLTALRSGSSA